MATILVVDDSAYARRLMRRTLEAREHTVIEAGGGLAALESFVVSRPEVVMLDLTMEDLGGMEVLGRLREIDPDVRVIIVSADIQKSTGKMVEEAGAFRFLAKPADPEEVVAAVSAALGEVPR